ncbi:alpha/beta hydrolase [Muricoccus aerilatus]|uniref:alpha/beta hydrolase n=1 Tax=Muricoccus aerilatus TaxID=452982 RepID=UPI0005C24ADE|nr:alpha/beta hydrolase [Roseomonas aerilata]
MTPGTKIWRDYDQAGLDAAYDQRVWAKDAADWIARYAADTAAARAAHPPEVYDTGAGLLDLYRAKPPARGIHLHVHGGAWRSLTRADAGMAAPALVTAGLDVAVPDFRLLPEFRLPHMVEDVVTACLWAAARGPLHLSGHSSGAHVAAVVATDPRVGPLLRSVTLLSGLYDLEPALLSARGAYVALDAAEAMALSPVHHVRRIAAPVVIGYGTAESPEFIRQSQDFAKLMGVEPIVLEGTNHFATAYALAEGPVHQAMLALV